MKIIFSKIGKSFSPILTPIEYFNNEIPVKKTSNTDIFEIDFGDERYNYFLSVLSLLPNLPVRIIFTELFNNKEFILNTKKLTEAGYEFKIEE